MAKRIIYQIILIGYLLSLLFQTVPVQAQPGSASDLIAMVNAYRSANGREAYIIDNHLMMLAQSHSEYQASIQSCTHSREDGTGPAEYGISAENIACGYNLSIENAIYVQWADQLHTATLLGPDSGLVGVGVATAGSTVYYTFDVKRLTGDFSYTHPNSRNASGSEIQAEQHLPAAQYAATSTPNEDGSIVHIVKYGDTLIDIAAAYGVSIADIISINKLDPANPAIFERQVLIIRLAFTETPFITATYTQRPATRTPMPTRTPRPTRTATIYQTPRPTYTPTKEPLLRVPTFADLGSARIVLAYTFIGIGALGLILLILTGFLPQKK